MSDNHIILSTQYYAKHYLPKILLASCDGFTYVSHCEKLLLSSLCSKYMQNQPQMKYTSAKYTGVFALKDSDRSNCHTSLFDIIMYYAYYAHCSFCLERPLWYKNTLCDIRRLWSAFGNVKLHVRMCDYIFDVHSKKLIKFIEGHLDPQTNF